MKCNMCLCACVFLLHLAEFFFILFYFLNKAQRLKFSLSRNQSIERRWNITRIPSVSNTWRAEKIFWSQKICELVFNKSMLLHPCSVTVLFCVPVSSSLNSCFFFSVFPSFLSLLGSFLLWLVCWGLKHWGHRNTGFSCRGAAEDAASPSRASPPPPGVALKTYKPLKHTACVWQSFTTGVIPAEIQVWGRQHLGGLQVGLEARSAGSWWLLTRVTWGSLLRFQIKEDA